MGMTYTDSFETRKAVSDMKVGGVTYRWDYIATSPIDGNAREVNATLYRVEGETDARLGYANYINGSTNVLFNSSDALPVDIQEVVCGQFYADLKQLLFG